MWQANYVKDALRSHYPQIEVEIIGVTTQADELLELSLATLGGKGAFVKELEQALLLGEADLAVHSMKDVTINLPDELRLSAILEREDPRDVLVSNKFGSISELPGKSCIGTSSLRRTAQLRALHPHLDIKDIRGNVGTRLRKLDEGEFDGLILAAAGVNRLQLSARVSEYVNTDILLPAVGQGAMGIEILSSNEQLQALLEPLSHTETELCVRAERAINRRLGGDCHVPIAAYAQAKGKTLSIEALVARLDGSEILRASTTGLLNEAEQLGDELGRELLRMGAGEILAELDDGS